MICVRCQISVLFILLVVLRRAAANSLVSSWKKQQLRTLGVFISSLSLFSFYFYRYVISHQVSFKDHDVPFFVVSAPFCWMVHVVIRRLLAHRYDVACWISVRVTLTQKTQLTLFFRLVSGKLNSFLNKSVK